MTVVRRIMPKEEFTERWDRARQLMKQYKMDALFITEKYDYWYFTGNKNRQFDHMARPMLALLPMDRDPVFIIYGRDAESSLASSYITDVRSYVDVPFPLELVRDTFKEYGLDKARVGTELGIGQRLGLSYIEFEQLKREFLPEAEFVNSEPLITNMRVHKSDREAELIKVACDIALRAWDRLIAEFRAGMTANDAVMRMCILLIEEGADSYTPGHVTMGLADEGFIHTYQPGDVMWCDFGAVYYGYHSDLARRAVFGKPTAEQVRDHERVWKILQAEIASMKPGVKCSEVAAVANEVQKSFGLQGLVGSKRIGHGIGLHTSDPPSISLADHTVLEPGMVLTPEPRFFIANGDRVHIEEDVVITKDGARWLSHGAEELKIIKG